MSWVVKAWKPALLQAAEREARRLRRAAGREADDATAYLLVLEDLGTELREDVRRQRRAPEGEPEPEAGREPEAAPQPNEIRATRSRPARASLRDSPLSELFRATG